MKLLEVKFKKRQNYNLLFFTHLKIIFLNFVIYYLIQENDGSLNRNILIENVILEDYKLLLWKYKYVQSKIKLFRRERE